MIFGCCLSQVVILCVVVLWVLKCRCIEDRLCRIMQMLFMFMLKFRCMWVSFSFLLRVWLCMMIVFISIFELLDWYLVMVCMMMFMLCLKVLKVMFVVQVLLMVISMFFLCVVWYRVGMLGIFIEIELGVLVYIRCVLGWISLVRLVLIIGLQKCVVILKLCFSYCFRFLLGLQMLFGSSMLLFVFRKVKLIMVMVVRLLGVIW